MEMTMYQFTDINIWCFAEADQLAAMKAYLDKHNSKLHYIGVFSRLIYHKIKFYPVSKSAFGKLFLKTVVRMKYRKNECLLPQRKFLKLLLLNGSEDIKRIFSISDEQISNACHHLE